MYINAAAEGGEGGGDGDGDGEEGEALLAKKKRARFSAALADTLAVAYLQVWGCWVYI